MANKEDQLKEWIYSQEGITIESLAKKLSCPVENLIVKVKQLTKEQPGTSKILTKMFLIENLHTLLKAGETIRKKQIFKPDKSVQKEYEIRKKQKKMDALNSGIEKKKSPRSRESGIVKETSGKSVRAIPIGHPKQ